MNAVLARYLADRAWPAGRERRMVHGLRILLGLARTGSQPVTYGEFAEQVQPGLAPLAAGRVLDDIGRFCSDAGWPNVTCFVVSAATGECSPGCRWIGEEGAAVAREQAWLSYAQAVGGPGAAEETAARQAAEQAPPTAPPAPALAPAPAPPTGSVRWGQTSRGGRTVARHLNDETAEFKMPRPGKHAAEDDAPEPDQPQEPEATQRFDPGFRDRPRPAPPAPPASPDR